MCKIDSDSSSKDEEEEDDDDDGDDGPDEHGDSEVVIRLLEKVNQFKKQRSVVLSRTLRRSMR